MTQYTDVKVKDLLKKQNVQNSIKSEVTVPNPIIIKQVRNPFTNKETNETTQKIHAVSGTSLADMVELDFTLVGQTLDGKQAINKVFQLIDYNFALEANMRGGNFNGYSATGLKLLVTKLSEMKAGEK